MVTTPSFTQYCQVFCHNVSHVILSFLKHHVIVFPRTISRYSVCKSDFWRHLLTKTVLTTTHSYCLPSNFTNGREEFIAGILPQKEIALLLWQDEKKKGRKDEEFCGSGRKWTSRRKWGGFFFVCLVKVIKSLTHTHWQKLPSMTSHSVANNKVLVKDWNKVGNSQQSQSTSKTTYRDCTHTHTHTQSRLCCKHRHVALSWRGKWIQTPPVALYVSAGYCLLHQMTNINFHQTIRPLSLTLSLSGCVSFPFLLAFPRLQAPGIHRAAIWSPGPTFTTTMGPVLDAQFIKEKNEMAGEWDGDRGEFCGWL